MGNIKIHIDHNSSIPKYRQIVRQVSDAAGSGKVSAGDPLPSVNELILSLDISRDTAFKAYENLKNLGIIEAFPGKGYFIRNVRTRVLLFLDKYSPFKEGLYNSLRKNLPANFSIDLYFHHYNIKVFADVLTNAVGRYNFFVIMSFDHKGITDILQKMDKNKVLMLDVTHRAPEFLSMIYQDFRNSFYECLVEAVKSLKQYREVIYVLRPETHHPVESAEAFQNFCSDYHIKGKTISELVEEQIKKNFAYIVVSDDDLVMIIEKASKKKFRLGVDIGLISYNDTPVKKVIAEGITVISTDFIEMGKSVATYLLNPGRVNKRIPTRLIRRKSL